MLHAMLSSTACVVRIVCAVALRRQAWADTSTNRTAMLSRVALE